MALVTELEVFTAVASAIGTATGNWLQGKDVYFGRRSPNGANPPHVVVAVEEQENEGPDSDGDCQQVFVVEIMAKAVGPDDTASMNEAIVELDPVWSSDSPGLTLADTDKGVTCVVPKPGKLRLIEQLRDGGQDQYTATRRWEVRTAALIGA